MPYNSRIVWKTLVFPFYRRNAALFTFLIYLLFGSFPGMKQCLQFHYYILLSMGKTPVFFLLTVAIWSLYTFKALHFLNGCLQQKSYSFLRVLNCLTLGKRWQITIIMTCLILAPVLLYGIAGITIALLTKNMLGTAVLLFTLMVFVYLSADIFIRMLGNSNAYRFQLPQIRLHKNLFHYLLRYMLHQQIILLLILKTLSFCCLYYFVTIDTAVFDSRIAQLFFSTSLAGHCVLIYRNHHFMETQLSFYRNLPVSSLITLANIAAAYVVILLPEYWALKGVVVVQHDLVLFIRMVLTAPLMLLMLHGLLYTEAMRLQEFLQLLFGVWLLSIFFSLSANWWIWPLICAGMALFLFLHSYRAYEQKASPGNAAA